MNIRVHRRSPNGRWCLFCGHTCNEAGEFNVEATCLTRDDGQDPRAMRPEPALRQSGVNDQDMISRRLTELYSQRTEAMNHIDDGA